MLAAVAEDFAALPGLRVSLLWNPVLGRPPCPAAVEVIPSTSETEPRTLTAAARHCDCALIIAPECGGILAERSAWVAETSCRLIGPTAAAAALCGDKLACVQFLEACRLPTLPTRPWSSAGERGAECVFPAVIKPRAGAGSTATYFIGDESHYRRLLPRLQTEPELLDAVWQPYQPGTPVSVALVGRASGASVWPVCLQRLSADGRFHYLGGSVPVSPSLADKEQQCAVQELARRAWECLPGLTGYVGFDLILPPRGSGTPRIIEINPRLTTSYLGYRQLSSENLAYWLLEQSPAAIRPPRWLDGPVLYGPDCADE